MEVKLKVKSVLKTNINDSKDFVDMFNLKLLKVILYLENNRQLGVL